MHLKHLMTSVWNNQDIHIHGLLKSSPEDFLVDEIPLYEPCGSGEHLYLRVQKTNMSHDSLIRRVAKQFGVQKRDVGCAGRKDLTAVTSQMLSVYLPGKHVEIPETIDGITVCMHVWHTNKLRLGHLAGNRFTVRLREVCPEAYGTIEDRLLNLGEMGLPNAFGPQRFGNTNSNHTYGHYLVTNQWQKLVDALLVGDGKHHGLTKEGEFQKALDAWPFGQPAQRSILEALAKGRSYEQALKTIPHSLVKLYVNAFQSALFNEVLQQRVKANTHNTIVEGDLVWKLDGGGRTFIIASDEVGTPGITMRSSRFEITPSGPLWGAKMRLPTGDVLQMEKDVLDAHGITPNHLLGMKKQAQGARRPLCVPLKNTSMQVDEECVVLQFDLPAGSYATVVVDALLNGIV